MYKGHGKELNFAGVILQRIRFETSHGKEVGAQNAAGMAKAMGADGALINWIGGGKQGTDSAVPFYVPEADAIVSTGSLDRTIGPYNEIKIFPFPGAAPVSA